MRVEDDAEEMVLVLIELDHFIQLTCVTQCLLLVVKLSKVKCGVNCIRARHYTCLVQQSTEEYSIDNSDRYQGTF